MLVLSILIMLALGVAVASFFISGAQWLVFLSAALVLFAFYLSRRAAPTTSSPDSDDDPTAARRRSRRPGQPDLRVAIDDGALESGRARAADDPIADDTDEDGREREELDRSRPENGRAVAT